jgi:hypothetical protein
MSRVRHKRGIKGHEAILNVTERLRLDEIEALPVGRAEDCIIH